VNSWETRSVGLAWGTKRHARALVNHPWFTTWLPEECSKRSGTNAAGMKWMRSWCPKWIFKAAVWAGLGWWMLSIENWQLLYLYVSCNFLGAKRGHSIDEACLTACCEVRSSKLRVWTVLKPQRGKRPWAQGARRLRVSCNSRCLNNKGSCKQTSSDIDVQLSDKAIDTRVFQTGVFQFDYSARGLWLCRASQSFQKKTAWWKTDRATRNAGLSWGTKRQARVLDKNQIQHRGIGFLDTWGHEACSKWRSAM